MPKLWQTKSTKLHPLVEKYTVGSDYILDMRLLPFDVEASKAHAQALVKAKIITAAEYRKVAVALNEVLKLHQEGKFEIKISDEDCHTAIENYLVGKLWGLGQKSPYGTFSQRPGFGRHASLYPQKIKTNKFGNYQAPKSLSGYGKKI